jgi:hypothetical protein
VSFGIYLYRYDPNGDGEAERRAVLAALPRWGWDGSAGSPYQIASDDGITVELYSGGLDGGRPFEGCNLEVHAFSVGLCRLVLDLARAGRLTISSDGEPDAVILTGEAQRAELPADVADHPKVMVCRTPEELEAALDGGFEKWREFRDSACGRSSEDDPA